MAWAALLVSYVSSTLAIGCEVRQLVLLSSQNKADEKTLLL
jgi:hypothetical protein